MSMKNQRFLSDGSALHEMWCANVENSGNRWCGLPIGDLVEQTDEYEIYICNNIMTGLPDEEPKIKIKVYLDPKVTAGGNFHLGTSSDKTLDIDGVARDKICVFEFLEGEDKYDEINALFDETQDNPEEATNETSDSTDTDQEEHTFIDTVDQDTGIIYSVDENGYVWENGQKTNKWFASNGKLIDPDKAGKSGSQEDEPAKPKGFAAVAGMHDLKAEMLDEVKFVIDNPEKAKKYGLHLPNGMLLYGYPGCGKTFFAEKLAEELKVKFMYQHGSDIGSHFMHETEQNIAKLFKDAKAQAPCIICIDEIDGFLPYRRDGVGADSAYLNAEVNEFLTQMNNCGKDNVMVIGTTNNPHLIDPALLRTGRMDKLVFVPLPDKEARTEMLKMMTERVPHDEDMNLEVVSDACEGMVMSDMEYMFHQLVLKCAREDKKLSEEMLTECATKARRSVYPHNNEDEEAQTAITLRPAAKVKGFGMAV